LVVFLIQSFSFASILFFMRALTRSLSSFFMGMGTLVVGFLSRRSFSEWCGAFLALGWFTDIFRRQRTRRQAPSCVRRDQRYSATSVFS
jgi:hypothetical protein